jgi:endonuclease/exonuclease/phosphatase family metal-dependent hydrolase
MAALNAAHVPYDLAAVNTVNDLALAGNQVPALRLTERNALLVRSDLRPPDFHLSDIHSHLFSATLPFAGHNIAAGWIEAMVHTGNKHFRLVATHLQSPVDGVPEATDVQMAQAKELIHELRNSAIPVVLCGDFNSDAAHKGHLDDTGTADLFPAAGYLEVWPLLHGGDPGFTWPMYLEDQLPAPPFFAPFSPFERIDLFFEQGIPPISIDQVIAPTGVTPPFGSDHAGVIAVFRPS